MADISGNYRSTFSAEGAAVLSESDTATFPRTRAVYVGGTGDLVVTMASGVDCTFSSVPAGTLLPISIIALKAATTATLIVGLS